MPHHEPAFRGTPSRYPPVTTRMQLMELPSVSTRLDLRPASPTASIGPDWTGPSHGGPQPLPIQSN